MPANSPGKLPRMNFIAVDINKMGNVARQWAEQGIAAKRSFLVDACEADASALQCVLFHVPMTAPENLERYLSPIMTQHRMRFQNVVG